MAYEPYKDYFGLSNIAWGKSHLDTLMTPRPCRADDDASPINRELILPSDPLDSIRSNANEDFLYNGVANDLDDIDLYQSRLRNTAVSEPKEIVDVPTTDYRRRRCRKEKRVCVFCRNNGETPTVYKSHTLKDNLGRTTCPILRRYTCPLCKASGDTAHTIRYCPTNEGGLGASLSLLLDLQIDGRSSAGNLPIGH